MNWGIVGAAVAMTLVMCVGCGQDNTQNIPNPRNPTNNPSQSIPNISTSGTSGLPDLSSAATLRLYPNSTSYTGIEEMFGSLVVAPPIVGDPKLLLDLARTETTKLDGKMLFFFEDGYGAAWLEQSSVANTGYLGPVGGQEVLDVVFQDDLLVTRVQAIRTGDDLKGGLYYRVRASGEDQCKSKEVGCTCVGGPCSGPLPAYCYVDTTTLVNDCRNYMAYGSASQVKYLGSFGDVPDAKVSKWVPR